MWEAEPHHSVCHPVSLNSCSCLLTVILICTQHGAGLEAVFVLPPQSRAHGRLRTSYFSTKKPRTFAFDYQIVLMSSCLLFFFSSFQQHCTKPQDHWAPLCPKERGERAAKPHNQSRGANSWLDSNTGLGFFKHYSYHLRKGDVSKAVLMWNWARCSQWSPCGPGMWGAFRGPRIPNLPKHFQGYTDYFLPYTQIPASHLLPLLIESGSFTFKFYHSF